MVTTVLENDRFARHRALLDRAVAACRTRESWTAFSDNPADHPGGPSARAAGAEWLEGQLGRPFEMNHPGQWRVQTDERSPYTGLELGVAYPAASVDELITGALTAWPAWRDAPFEERADVCLEICEQLYSRGFELAFAALHTTGQSFGMSYTGSGTNAIDRGIEAIAQAQQAVSRVAATASWSRAFGGTQVGLDKRYRLMPLGVGVVISCASFPAWNAYPALLASLVTGNPVILKPHPTSVLQMALAVRIFRAVLADAGFDPNLISLAVDTVAEPVAKQLVQHPETRIVDFTGSAAFGSWIEDNARRARVYTETSGMNSVVVQSVEDLAPVLRAIAGSLCLFSAQMCTRPQNIFIPRTGVRTADDVVTPARFAELLADAVRAISTVPKRAASIMATVQSSGTLELLGRLTETVARRGQVILEPAAYAHPDFPDARTSGPLIGLVDRVDHDLYGQEQFGPVAFVITADNAWAALDQATTDARVGGAITAFVYSTDPHFLERAETAYAVSGAALSINLTGPMPLNFSAAYSDYHVSGLNPAGNATLSDESFIAGRFRVVQSRRPAVPSSVDQREDRS